MFRDSSVPKKFITLCLVLLSGIHITLTKSQPLARNVIMISIDDMNDWVYSLPGISSEIAPTFDSLLQNAAFYSNAFSNAPLCNPSRVSFLTGLYPKSTGIYSNSQTPFRNELPYATTIFDYFKEHGYKTIGLGKIFHLEDSETEDWDFYFPYGGRPSPTKKPGNNVENISPFFDWANLDLSEQDWPEYKMFEHGLKLLEQQKDPFILALGTELPHGPWYVPRKYYNEVKEIAINIINQPADRSAAPRNYFGGSNTYYNILESGELNEAWLHYAASIRFIDELIGRFLNQLKRSPHYENTIVVISSDHGWHLGEKLQWGKGTLWNESLKVPLIFAGKMIEKDSWKTDQLVELIDVFPTILSLTGLPSYSLLQGEDLSNTSNQKIISFSDENNYSTILNGNKLIKYGELGFDLFDLTNDNDELNNNWPDLSDETKAIMISAQKNEIVDLNIDFDSDLLTSYSIEKNMLKWHGDYLDHVEIEISLENDFSRLVYRESNFTNELKLEDHLIISASYYVRLRTVNPQLKGTWTEPIKFPFEGRNLKHEDWIIGPMPNPVNDQLAFYIHNVENEVFSLVITDSLGQIIFQETSSSKLDYVIITQDVSQWRSGIYFINVKLGGHYKTKKIVKL